MKRICFYSEILHLKRTNLKKIEGMGEAFGNRHHAQHRMGRCLTKIIWLNTSEIIPLAIVVDALRDGYLEIFRAYMEE